MQERRRRRVGPVCKTGASRLSEFESCILHLARMG
jgi:hypothetical protein